MPMYVGAIKSYTPVEYIESSGTQSIDTGVTPSSNIRTIVDFQFSSLPAATSQGLVGAWDPNKGMIFGIQNNSGNLVFRFAFGTSAWAGSSIAADTNRHTVYMNDENGNGRLDNTTLANGSSATSLSSTYGMTLFSFMGSVTYKAYCKIYSCQMYENDTLIRNFIPALDRNNVACMYEQVEEKFYYNKGTGVFTAGNVTGQPVILGSVAKKISQAFVGISGVARKIVKGYVGVSGIARLIFSKAPVFTVKKLTNLDYPRYGGLTNTTDYFVHGGGHNSNNTLATTTEWYSKNGTKTTASALNKKRVITAVASFNGNAFFCGGSTTTGSWGSNRSNAVEYYTNSQVRVTSTNLSYSTYGAVACSNSTDYLIVCGGQASSALSTANFFDTTYTRTSGSLSYSTGSPAIGNMNGYIIVAGGTNGSASLSTVNSFDKNKTRQTLSSLPVAKASMSYAAIKDCFIIAGGSSASHTGAANDTAYAITKDLVITTAPSLSKNASGNSASQTSNKYVLIPIGSPNLDVYDKNMVLTTYEITQHSAYEWACYGRNATSIDNIMIYNNQDGNISMIVES